MKFVHVLEDYAILIGGISTVVRNLHLNPLHRGHKFWVVTSYREEEDVVAVPIKKKVV